MVENPSTWFMDAAQLYIVMKFWSQILIQAFHSYKIYRLNEQITNKKSDQFAKRTLMYEYFTLIKSQLSIDLYRVTVWKGTYFRAKTPHKIKAKTACKTVPWSKLRFSIFVWSAVCIIGAFRLENFENFENSQKRTMGLTIFNI